MPVMWMMQVRADREVVMVTMRNPLVPTIGTVLVTAGVLGTTMRRRALRRIATSNGHPMLVYMIAVDVVQVTVVHIVCVTIVLDGAVPATAAVLVRVLGMSLAGHLPPPLLRQTAELAAEPL